MNKPIKFLPLAVFTVGLFFVSASAQNNTGRVAATTSTPETASAGLNPSDVLSFELSELRKTLQSLNSRLRDLNPNRLTPGAKTETVEDRQKKILKSLEILNSSEQRAELLRKQLVESVEKETSIRSRVINLEEEMRPENVERNSNMNLIGSTRAPEQRDARRRGLENERNGLRSLLGQIEQSRQRLEDDLRNADGLVVRLRQRVLPLIEREVDNLTSP
jgi:hypothetical protein